MAENWQVGDLALCIRQCPSYPPEVQPGSINTVEYVWADSCDAADPTFLGVALDLVGVPRMPGDISYWAGSFVKVTPPAADEFDRETIALLTRAPAAVPA